MTFLNPTYLWGLLGLAIPLAIHLWSKKEGKTIKIGSIQLLSEANPKQASSIQLNELFLLFLRLLVIALLAFILAAPQLKRNSENSDLVYLIEPSLLKDPEIRAMIDSLPEGSIHLLKADFPKWERDKAVQNPEDIPNYWQLAQETKNLHADSVVVFTRALLQGIHGKRPVVNTNINWVILNPETVENRMLLSEKQGDSIELVSVNSNSNQLTFNAEKISRNSAKINQKGDSISLARNGKPLSLPLTIQDTLRVQILASDSLTTEKKYISASFRALCSYIDQPLTLSEIGDSINTETDVLVWLKEEPIPEISGQILTYKSNIFAQNLIDPTINRNVFHLTQHLNSENVISGNLPEQLLALLDLHPNLDERIAPYDLRSISKNEMQTRQTDSNKIKNYAQAIDLSPWFWLALILLLITERITAYYRKQ